MSSHFYVEKAGRARLLFPPVQWRLQPGQHKRLAGQPKILALIMLRNAFKTLGEMQEPIDPSLDIVLLSSIVASCIAAVIIFICSSAYVHIQQYSYPVPGDGQKNPIYDGAKKFTALALLSLFLFDGFSHLGALVMGSESLAAQASFFARFYTLLIFADLFLLLASEGCGHNPILLFRNSGYTAGALFMRMALGAPHFWDAALGVFAALYILAISYAVKRLWMQRPENQQKTNSKGTNGAPQKHCSF